MEIERLNGTCFHTHCRYTVKAEILNKYLNKTKKFIELMLSFVDYLFFAGQIIIPCTQIIQDVNGKVPAIGKVKICQD